MSRGKRLECPKGVPVYPCMRIILFVKQEPFEKERKTPRGNHLLQYMN